jgi:hypothetical protein
MQIETAQPLGFSRVFPSRRGAGIPDDASLVPPLIQFCAIAFVESSRKCT